jgi:hypothetical protein
MTPDYHNSFLLRDELRALGWRADILVDRHYPALLLYSNKEILHMWNVRNANKYFSLFLSLFQYLYFLIRYRNHCYFGKLPNYFRLPKILNRYIESNGFTLHLWLAKIFRNKIIYVPSGCLDEFTKAEFLQFDKGNVCNNCGSWDICNDIVNILNFKRVRRYSSLNIGSGAFESKQFNQEHIRYRSLDLEKWKPELEIPKEFQKKFNHQFTILHSFFDENRRYLNRNIKGTPSIKVAIEKLKEEGFDIELVIASKVPISEMRFLQAQVDIVIDELLYGWHGSMTIECLALGKPVICYLRDESRKLFELNFPDAPTIPIISAQPSNLTDVLRSLLISPEQLKVIGIESRRFAESHFDVAKNATDFARILRNLS